MPVVPWEGVPNQMPVFLPLCFGVWMSRKLLLPGGSVCDPIWHVISVNCYIALLYIAHNLNVFPIYVHVLIAVCLHVCVADWFKGWVLLASDLGKSALFPKALTQYFLSFRSDRLGRGTPDLTPCGGRTPSPSLSMPLASRPQSEDRLTPLLISYSQTMI